MLQCSVTLTDTAMTPVIRISDEVFRKLQALSEPLVDTPNSVIERLLESATAAGPKGSTQPGAPAPRARQVTAAGGDSPGLFLAPASAENIAATISRGVRVSDIVGRLDAATAELLRRHVEGERFHCWAMTVSSRGTFDNMSVGDLVLFTPKGTGRFTYRATVAGKLESQTLGDLLWSVTPGKPWSLIYLLSDVRRVDIDKERLVAEFGYDRSFRVFGITRVQSERMRSALTRRGSLESVLRAATLAAA